MALLHALTHAGFRDLVVCHLNHQLRGRASAGDARFVKTLAARLGHPCECGSIPVADRALAAGKSIETAARDARHDFFADCARKWKCRRLLLAHHADDQAETVLWNLLRGSHGVVGMEASKSLRVGRITLEIQRPLLGIRRAAILEWLHDGRLKWREDATNATPFTIRNRLRHEAIPLLDAISGRDAAASLSMLAEDMAATREITRWAVRHAQAHDPQGRIHLPAMRKLPPALRGAVMAAWLADHRVPVSRALVTRCLAVIAPAAPPAVNLPGGGILRRRAGRLMIESPAE